MNEFWIAVVAAIVGGVAGYVAASFQSHRELGRRRRAIATAMLAELEALDLILRQVEEYRQAYPFLALAPRMDVLERTSDYVDVLSPDTVRRLLALNIVLRAERIKIEHGQKNFAQSIQSPRLTEAQRNDLADTAETILRDKARDLLTRTAAVRRLLIGDGGVHVEIPSLSGPELPKLPGR